LFLQSVGSVTSSVPQIDVEGKGWEIPGASPGLELDGHGHLLSTANGTGASAGVQLIPIGPHGSMSVSATISLPPGSADWVGFGFSKNNQLLTANGSQTGPWVKIQGNGNVILYGGAGDGNPVSVQTVSTNQSGPAKFILTYDAFQATASLESASNGLTNSVFRNISLTNSAEVIVPRYLLFEFSSSSVLPDRRQVSDVAVDWSPRPHPLLTLPSPPPANVILLGPPTGQSDISAIQAALNSAATLKGGGEVRFKAGATYVITNSSTVSGMPLLLTHSTNVLVNGNGCKILVRNPRIGFLDMAFCTNIIVQGFTIDYDPLPFTQGVVTAVISSPGPAFEFRLDAGYPDPTGSDFLDIAQWGTFMDSTRPGRLADNHSTIYEFSSVVTTKTNGIYKVTLHNRSKLPTIQVGDKWCQLARWNGSPLFRARNCYQVTWLDITGYTGAAAAFAGNASSLVNEINCQIVIGPSPGGTNGVPRVKTTNADGGLFGNPRIGPWVEGCNFIGMSDDVANANTLPFFISGPVTEPTNTFHLIGYTPGGGLADLASQEVQVGDDVTFYNGTNGVVFNRATITKVDPPYVTFDHSISNVFPGQDTTNTLIFDNSLNTSAVYLNNRFSNSRIHGIYCRANNILIAHNFITGMGVSAIAAHPALGLAGPNSFIPTNVVIMANVLADGGCSYEAVNNSDPSDEPTWALIQLHKAVVGSDYVPEGQEISGIRILNNSFTEWRRGAITLHNVTDANIIGNYFGPPMTNNALSALTNHVVADLWACDYKNMRIERNVKSDILSDAKAIRQDGKFATITSAFQALIAPDLALTLETNNAVVGWDSPTPAFVLQKADVLGGATNWSDWSFFPYISGNSNTVVIPEPDPNQVRFFRARQR
ncbi:MAG: hypothetical protein JWM99_3737, partial [Verrucomicrobiales bacterium]|nr:hypothetical protein [Verrucomicrobiales bacterium]